MADDATSHYGSGGMQIKLMGRGIMTILGYMAGEALIHRNDLVLC